MDTPDPDSAGFRYDEFAYFEENRSEYSLGGSGRPAVERVHLDTTNGSVSALRWGTGAPQLVLVHGTAQNAHTWDTVMLALGQTPALAVDLPGHGRSGWRSDARYDPHTNAETLREALGAVLDSPVVLVGMSLGGLTVNRMAAQGPGFASRIVVVDITPGVTRDKAREIHDFIAGPQSFDSFAEILGRTVEFNPTRTVASLRRGILHNAHRNPDGRWEWNYHRAEPDAGVYVSREDLWSDIAATSAPYLLVRGGDSPVTDEADVAELYRHRPDAVVELVHGSGHSIQGDRPVELAGLIREELNRAVGSA
jgi:pimeloyl-ACP methyl ester carboxylesterase